MDVGSVRELWRYPVKSMGGERIDATEVATNGFVGDRGWVVRDETNRRFGSAKRMPQLFSFVARYEGDVQPGVTPALITLPDGSKIASDDRDAARLVGEALGRPVTLWPLQPAENEEFYREVPRPPGVDPVADGRALLGLEGDEPFPDMSGIPKERRTFQAPPGTYFDAYPIHLATSAALESVRRAVSPDSGDVRRFRSNIVVDTGELQGHPEFNWAGKRVRIGTAEFEGVVPCVRCAMVTHPQPGIERDTPLMRHLVRETGQNFGLYMRVAAPGRLQVGDRVEVL